MKLSRKNNSLAVLALEVPALTTDKEGLLKGGFCSFATQGEAGLFAQNSGCDTGCNDKCVDGCKTTGCNKDCNYGCKIECTSPEDTSKAANPGAALMGFSLVF